MECVRQRTATECLAQFVGPAGPGLADDEDRVRGLALRVPPLGEQARDLVVEEFVGRRRAAQVVVDVVASDGLEDGVAGDGISLLAPGDQQRTSSVRMEMSGFAEQVDAGCAVIELVCGDDQRNGVVGLGQGLDALTGRLRRGEALDPVLTPVAVGEFACDAAQCVFVVIDDEQHGLGHLGIVPSRCSRSARARRRPSRCAILRPTARTVIAVFVVVQLVPYGWWPENSPVVRDTPSPNAHGKLNFSERPLNDKQLGDAIDVIESDAMPPGTYTVIHRNARLTATEAYVLTAALEVLGGSRDDHSGPGR